VTITDGNSQPQVTASASLFNGIVRIAFDASDPDGAADIASVTAENLGNGETASALYPERPFPWNEFTMSAVGWEPGLHTLAVMIRDQANTLGYLALAEVTIPGTPSSFAADLAADIADETTLTIANARFTGTEDSSGIFDFGLYRGLQLDQGVALTTGLFSSWNAGDLFDDTDKQWGLAGDEELFFRVAGATTHDAAVLEFDVFCVNGQLVIDYQFGTEEYDEYVERFNDAFMITVDGVPVSLLPDCSDIVGVQSVNLSENRHLFLGDDEDIDANEMVDPDFEDSKVEYDGMTLRLRANALVTPGQSHHVRIVIADVNDALLDAALFLGQGSFKTVQP
jgi:hypothetical protein